LGRIRGVVAPARLLDIGCGGGHLLAAAIRHGYQGVGTDLSYEACAIARHRSIPTLQADGTILPFRSRSLNIVTLINVLDHLPDPLATLQEVFRVLAPGGYLVIRIPNAAFHRSCIRALCHLGPLIRRRGWDQYPILHLFAFTGAGLFHTVSRAGLRVLSVRNSPAAIDGFRSLGASVNLRKVFTLISSTARIIEIVSRGQWLLGASIELYAQRPADGIGGSGPPTCATEL
jgi:SAM-dependent methyltransferase